jgi:glycosyltransferase involved in cell wall biosynthesis
VSRERLIVVGPIPPPVHGVAISTSLVLANPLLRDLFEVEHLNTTDRRSISNLGRWDTTNVLLGIRNVFDLAHRLRGARGLLYLPLSENAGGFLRDSLFIQLAATRGWKVAVHIRNSLFREFYGSQGALVRWWIRFTLRRLTALAVLGASLRSLFDGLVPAEKISVVPNGTPNFHPGAVVPDPHKVVYLSNLSKKKGADVAVEAAALVVKRNANANFIFAGEWESPDFEKNVRSRMRGADGRIVILPPVTGEEKRELMASAWALLFPVAWGEGHPRIVLEALAAGVPIVTTDRATIAETVGDGECGFVLPEPSPEAVADRVLTLLSNHDLRARMSAAARAKYLDRFTQEQADHQLADWLASLVDDV